MGGGDVNVPPPTPEENALRAEQTALLRQQRELLLSQQRQNMALLPLFGQQLGLKLNIDPKTGEIKGASELPGFARQRQLQEQVMEQTLKQLLLAPQDLKTQQQLQARQREVLDLQLRELQGRLSPTEVARRRQLETQQQELFGLQLQEIRERLTDPQAKQRKEIERLLGERTLKALRGELEVDPALERDIKKQGQTLRERLQSQFGPGFETSSAGIEALQRFEESANVLRSEARRGELTLSEQLSLSRQGADIATGGQGLAASQIRIPGIDPLGTSGFAFGSIDPRAAGSFAGGVAQQNLGTQGTFRQVLGAPLGIAGGLGQVAGGFQMPIGQLQNQRQMELDASIANAQNQMGFLGGVGSVFGSILGAVPFMSDEAIKTVDGKIAEASDGMGVFLYRRDDGVERIGVIAQDVYIHRPHAVVEGEDGFFRVFREAL